MLSDQQGSYVWVIGDGNKAEQRRIQLGQSTAQTAVVSSGLKEGEMVVVDGVQRVRPGLVVNPGPASPAPTLAAQPPEDLTPMISSVFVDRPRLAIVIAIIMTLAGALAMLRIPVAQFPDIVPPQVQVTTTYPGASATVVEATVAQPLEAQVNGADRMIYMKSNSANDGSYGLTVSFELGTNPDIDTVNVNNRVQAALSPPAAGSPEAGCHGRKSARPRSWSSSPSAARAPSRTRCSSPTTSPSTSWTALSRVPGVGSASLFGALNYSMRIWFDTDRLISLNLAPSDIIAAIQAQNVQAAVGRVGARPTSNDTQFQINLQTTGRLTTPEQFGDIVIRANPDGSLLRVRDVARVELGAATQDSESRLNGNPAVTLGIYLSPGANAVQTSQRVQQALDELATRFPQGLKSTVFYDSSDFVADTIHEVIKTLARPSSSSCWSCSCSSAASARPSSRPSPSRSA